MVFIQIFIFIVLILYEVPKLIRERKWRELAVYSFFMVFAFIVSFMLVAGLEMPMPGRVLQHLLKDYLHLNYK